MKICILADPVDEQYAGVHFYTKNLIKHLLKNDNENEYILIHCNKNPEITNWITNRKTPTKEIIIKNYRHIPFLPSLRKFIQLPLIFKKFKPDIILETAHIGPFSFYWKCREITIIYDLTPILFPKYHTLPSRIIHKLLFPRVIKRASGIITISRSSQKDIQKIYKTKAPIQITYPGCKKITNEDPLIFTKAKITKPYILTVGTIEPRKNLKILLKALSTIKEDIPNLQWVIVGKKGWGYRGFMKEIQKSKFVSDIIIVDYIKEAELTSLYKKAQAMVYPSLYEGFGLPPLEAMQCGCPVICSNTSSLPEVVGDAGITFCPENVTELKHALYQVLTDKKIRLEMSKKGLEQAQKFSWDKCAKQTINFFKQLQ